MKTLLLTISLLGLVGCGAAEEAAKEAQKEEIAEQGEKAKEDRESVDEITDGKVSEAAEKDCVELCSSEDEATLVKKYDAAYLIPSNTTAINHNLCTGQVGRDCGIKSIELDEYSDGSFSMRVVVYHAGNPGTLETIELTTSEDVEIDIFEDDPFGEFSTTPYNHNDSTILTAQHSVLTFDVETKTFKSVGIDSSDNRIEYAEYTLNEVD